jgi:hypothetical protein
MKPFDKVNNTNKVCKFCVIWIIDLYYCTKYHPNIDSLSVRYCTKNDFLKCKFNKKRGKVNANTI